MQPARIVLFGIRCRFTRIVAERLSQSQHRLEALLLPGPPLVQTPLRVRTKPGLLPMVAANPGSIPPDIATFQIGDVRSPSTAAFVESLEPDLIFVACFPRLIPESVIQLPQLGAFNIHPSLLPAHRGPDPLFWIMKDGGFGCGVTIHRLDNTYDSGAIVAQVPVPYPEGRRESEIEAILARVGADLAINVANAAIDGTLSVRVQNERLASYESWPTDVDISVCTNRSVADAWNFIRGVNERAIPVRVETASGPLRVVDAVAFGIDETTPTSASPADTIIRFKDGWIQVRTILNGPD